MVLDMAARLTSNPETRVAALTHDLGKGTTPPEILPAHHGHEKRSLALIEVLCDRLKAPRRFREMARIVAQYHGLAHKVEELREKMGLDRPLVVRYVDWISSAVRGDFGEAIHFRRP